MNELMQIMNLVRNSNNPMALIQQTFGGNPVFNSAMNMAQGKSPQELQQIIRNVAKERGMSEQQLNSFISQFGLSLN